LARALTVRNAMSESTLVTRRSCEPLFEALTVRGMTVPNRIVMAPMTRGFSPGGVPGPNVAAYYARRTTGGAGLILTEGIAVDHPAALGDAGLEEKDIPVIAGEAPLQGWRAVVAAVHAAGGRIVAQLWHQGVLRVPGTGPHPEVMSVSPSGYWGPLGKQSSIAPAKIPVDPQIGRPMSELEIEEAIQAFVRSACNAITVGFDAVALHGAHGYLIDNFLWEGTNRRNDPWGGDRARRGTFAIEIVRRIRAAIGDAYPIFFRFSQWKQQDFRATLASTPDELAEVLCPLAAAGVDVFDASVRYFNTPAFADSTLSLAGWAKKLTGRHSMAVGGVGINRGVYDKSKSGAAVDNIELVLARFEAGEFDLVAAGRAMLGDPHFARKVRSGEPTRPYEEGDLRRLE
jgi:2,4-dienoyl-CoA reductase-like NADH-dependent reductase (Old Yellow Enzyme family)